MEGYTDCVIAQQSGFGNAVAVLGTALGERHIKLLRRFVDRIVLVLDGDEAGRRRTDQILELFVAEQMDLRILTLPDELDPCDFLLSRGAAAFAALSDRRWSAWSTSFERPCTAPMPPERHARGESLRSKKCWRRWPRRRDCRPATSTAMRLKEDQILNRLAPA